MKELRACEKMPDKRGTTGILPAITGFLRLPMPARCQRYNSFTSSQNSVIPAKAGIQNLRYSAEKSILDPCSHVPLQALRIYE